jgi:hypothetical protein
MSVRARWRGLGIAAALLVVAAEAQALPARGEVEDEVKIVLQLRDLDAWDIAAGELARKRTDDRFVEALGTKMIGDARRRSWRLAEWLRVRPDVRHGVELHTPIEGSASRRVSGFPELHELQSLDRAIFPAAWLDTVIERYERSLEMLASARRATDRASLRSLTSSYVEDLRSRTKAMRRQRRSTDPGNAAPREQRSASVAMPTGGPYLSWHLQRKLAQDPSLADDPIRVRVTVSVIVLEGSVDSGTERTRAGEIVERHIPSGLRVENALRIGDRVPVRGRRGR